MEKLRILATSDIHGSILSHSYLNNQIIDSSLSRISTAIKHYQSDELILIDNGDVLQGSPLVAYNNRYQNHSIYSKALNYLNYDYFNLGNHDFNYGTNVLSRYLDETNAHCLTSNIILDNHPIGNTDVYTTKHNHKLAIIGVVTDYLHNWEQPQNLENITVKDVLDTVKQQVELYRDDVDTVVVVYHGGFEKDLTTGIETEPLTGENIGYELTSIAGIDILLTGHQHRSITQMVNGVLCLQCAHNAKEFMLLEYENNMWNGQLVSSSQFEIDPMFEEIFQDDETLTQQWLDTEIGHGPDMQIPNVFEAQVNKSLFTTFVNKVSREYFKADFAFSSLFNSSPGLKPVITMRDLIASYPFPNTFVLIEITKENLLAYLEKNASYFDLIDGKIGMNPKFVHPKLEMYDYDMGDGLSYQIDVSKPIGERVTILDIPNKDKYTMVVNNYRASGGGKFFMIRDSKKLKEEPYEVIDILYDYIEKNSPLNIENENNITVVYHNHL